MAAQRRIVSVAASAKSQRRQPIGSSGLASASRRLSKPAVASAWRLGALAAAGGEMASGIGIAA
jgi:hypothetical protein